MAHGIYQSVKLPNLYCTNVSIFLLTSGYPDSKIIGVLREESCIMSTMWHRTGSIKCVVEMVTKLRRFCYGIDDLGMSFLAIYES